MNNLSDYAEIKVLDHILKTAAYTPATNLYVGFSTADPLDTGLGIAEPSGNNYARVVCNTFDVAAGRATSNTGVITFNLASGAWGTITHWFISDALTGGNMIAYGQFTESKVVVSGNIPTIAAGEMDISVVTGAMGNYLANKILDHIFKTAVYTAPAHIYVALSTANPTDDASGKAEPSGSNYSRVICDAWDAAASGASQNTNAITMPTASGAWGTIGYMALMDAASAGNMLIYGAVVPSQAVGTNDYMEWLAGGLDITLN